MRVILMLKVVDARGSILIEIHPNRQAPGPRKRPFSKSEGPGSQKTMHKKSGCHINAHMHTHLCSHVPPNAQPCPLHVWTHTKQIIKRRGHTMRCMAKSSQCGGLVGREDRVDYEAGLWSWLWWGGQSRWQKAKEVVGRKKTQLEPLKNAFLLRNLILLFPCARFYLMWFHL